MTASAKTYLPTEEELTVQEINVSWPVLHASSFYVGKACETINNEYLLCKQELKDPRKCLQEGKEVTSCALNFLRQMKKQCLAEFNQYAHCLEDSSGTMEFQWCRRTQGVLDECVLKNLNVERPDYGYFCEARIHDSARPEPPKPELPSYPDAAPTLPDDAPILPAKIPNRYLFA